MAAAAALVALAAATGCPSSSDGRCETSALCDEGRFCFEGECVADLPAGSVTTPGTRQILDGGLSPASYSTTCPTPPPPAPPSGTVPAAWVQEFAAVPTGQAVSFQVPAGTASVTIHFQGTTPAPTRTVDFNQYLPDLNYVIPAEVTLPNGEPLYEYLDAFSTPLDPVLASGFFAPNPWTASFSVPSSHRLADLALASGELPAGTWKVRVADYQSECDRFGGCTPFPTGSYRVTVIAKPGPFVANGRLDLAVHFVGAVTATTARGTPAFQRFVDGIDRLLGEAGIGVYEVRFIQAPPTAVTAFSTTDISDTTPPPCDQLSRLFTLARPASPSDPGLDGVHLFLVDNLNSGGQGVVGLTGSIPGPTGLPGASTGGIVMSLQDITLTRRNPSGSIAGTCALSDPFSLLCDADFAAYVAAHEIGHWLGLLHPTAMEGDLLDPLEDTAGCACGACSESGCPPAGGVGIPTSSCLSDEGPCGGGWNLMFWQVDPNRSRGDLTREQGFVMRANPAVKWSTP
jgi:hypothetical protein